MTKKEIRAYTLDEGDLLYGESSLVREGIAKTLYTTKKGAGTAFAWHTRRYKINKQKVFPQYLYYLLDSPRIRRFLMSVATQTALTGITTKDYFSAPIKTPSLPEQHKIAEFLGAVDKWIEQLYAHKLSLESYKTGILQNIFSQEIRFKDDDGNNYPDWKDKKLRDMLSMVIDNRGKTPPIELTGIPLLEVNSLGKKSINYSRVTKHVNEEIYANWFRKHLQSGDILFSTVGATAQCSLYKGERKAVVAQNIIGLRFRNEDPHFMFYLLTEKNNNHQFKRIEMAAVQPSVKVSQIINIQFSLPPLPEQQKIANFLTSLDNLLESKEQKIAEAEQWKGGLMQNLFV